MFSTKLTKLLQFQLFCLLRLFRCSIISIRTLFTYHCYIFTHAPSSQYIYSIILVTTPAPTVFPPSRIANLNPSSIATAVNNSTFTFTLSPGITISAPPVKCHHPSNIRRPKIKLRPIPIKKWRMPPTLLFCQYICLSLILLVRRNTPRLRQHLAPLQIRPSPYPSTTPQGCLLPAPHPASY